MITLDKNLCKGCNICTEFCHQHVYEESLTLDKKGVYVPNPKNVERCTKCQICSLMCPDQAIEVEEDDED
ncbi:MAG: ferredoxin family protein [Methanobacteriaceae archaeon]|nr:ferredoxin family protein [Methanobacteriaceae archaeon]